MFLGKNININYCIGQAVSDDVLSGGQVTRYLHLVRRSHPPGGEGGRSEKNL